MHLRKRKDRRNERDRPHYFYVDLFLFIFMYTIICMYVYIRKMPVPSVTTIYFRKFYNHSGVYQNLLITTFHKKDAFCVQTTKPPFQNSSFLNFPKISPLKLLLQVGKRDGNQSWPGRYYQGHGLWEYSFLRGRFF